MSGTVGKDSHTGQGIEIWIEVLDPLERSLGKEDDWGQRSQSRHPRQKVSLGML